MTDHLVTVICPSSTLHIIEDALYLAKFKAEERVNVIMLLEALHNDDPKVPAGYTDTIDQVKYYREDAKQFGQAHQLAFNLWAHSRRVTDPETIAFYNWSMGLSSDDEVPLSMLQKVADGVL